MARVTDTLIVQKVDGGVVFADQATGEEVVVPDRCVDIVVEVLRYLVPLVPT